MFNTSIFPKILVLFSETGSYCIAQVDLKLMILLPQPPECWDYRHAPLHLGSQNIFDPCLVKSADAKL
jgi:hypothetical protein